MAGRLPSGHITKEISPEEKEEQVRDFIGYSKYYESNECLMRAYPGGWLLPSMYHKYSQTVSNFKFKPDDILVMTYPKCGTTWTQEIVWTMLHNKGFDHPMAKINVNGRCPFLELDMLLLDEFMPEDDNFVKAFKAMCPGKDKKDGMMWQIAEGLSSPRIMKTHLPLSFFSKGLIDSCKVIYVVRNPKDVLMSYLHHQKLWLGHGFQGNVNQFLDYFIDDKLVYSPFWLNVKEAWALKDHPNMLFISYEELKNKTKETYTRINDFIQAGLDSSKIDEIIEYTSFKSMKKLEEEMQKQEDAPDISGFNVELMKKDGGFFRKGETGTWKNKLNPMQVAKMDLWIKKNTIGTGLKFD